MSRFKMRTADPARTGRSVFQSPAAKLGDLNVKAHSTAVAPMSQGASYDSRRKNAPARIPYRLPICNRLCEVWRIPLPSKRRRYRYFAKFAIGNGLAITAAVRRADLVDYASMQLRLLGEHGAYLHIPAVSLGTPWPEIVAEAVDAVEASGVAA